jgi:hypothetical protein
MGARFSLPRGRTPAPKAQPEPSPEPAETTASPNETIQELAGRLRAVVQRELGRLESPGVKLSESDRRNNLKTATGSLKTLAEVTGELKEVPDSKLVKLPGFRRVLDCIIEALRPWPEAVRAVGEALDALDKK